MSLYHAYSYKNENYLFLTEYKQLFRISNEERSDLLNSNDKNVIRKYAAKVNQADIKKPKKIRHSRYGLFLCIANVCNARCVYCFASQGDYGKSQGVMDAATAAAAVDYYMAKVPDDCDAYIIFFGGEPLMSYDEIKETVLYTEKKYTGQKRYHFHVVTNATLLTKEMIDFFEAHKFGVAVSIDGGPAVQNSQRPLANGLDSYLAATSNLGYLFSKISNVHARGTYFNFDADLVSAYTDLISIGFKEVNIPPDILDIKSKEDMDKLLVQLDRLYEYINLYIHNHDDFPFGLFVTEIRRLFIPKIVADYGCGLGLYTFSVDISGNIYPCHRYSSDDNMILGNVNAGSEEKLIRGDAFVSSDCINCWNQYTCSHGCSYNDSKSKVDGFQKNPYWCMYSKKMTELCLTLAGKISETQLSKILGIDNFLNY